MRAGLSRARPGLSCFSYSHQAVDRVGRDSHGVGRLKHKAENRWRRLTQEAACDDKVGRDAGSWTGPASLSAAWAWAWAMMYISVHCTVDQELTIANP